MYNLLRNVLKERIFMATLGCCLAIIPTYATNPSRTQEGINREIQQAKTKIHGVVKDLNGEPIIGAKVIERGTNNGTITDFDGRFSLSVTGKKIEVSYIGFITHIVNVSGDELIITLKEDNKQLNEVIVVGYSTQKKANLTGSVGSVTMDDMAARPITNSSNALQGTVTGVYALQKSGKPGDDGSDINIRGIGTLNNSDPLVLIDGFPGSMSDVSSNDIASISVLKDAASAAIYGNRAANGVVLITTKKGVKGKMKISYDGYTGIQEVTALPDVLNSYDYSTLYNEACVNSNMAEKYSADEIGLFKSGTNPLYPNINYFNVYYGEANIHSHRLNFTGGTDDMHYAIMLGYLDQDGALIGTSYNKTDFRVNVDSYYLNKKLRLTTRLSGNIGKKQEPHSVWGCELNATAASVYPLYNEDGHFMALNGEESNYANVKTGSTNKTNRYVFNGQFEAEYEILEDFSYQLTYGYNVKHSNTNSFQSNVTLYLPSGGTTTNAANLSESNSLDTQSLLTSLLKYKKKIGNHQFNLLAGYSEEEFKWNWTSGYRKNFVNNTQRVLNLGDASTATNGSGKYALGLQSYFGRINYIFDNKYLFEANVRQDGSSRFASGNRWGTFPSFSAGWLLSEEQFMEDNQWLDLLKIRASWGKLGNQNINSYYVASQTFSSGQNYPFNGTLYSGIASTNMSNTETSWETTKQTDIGIDIALTNGISVTADYFIKKTDGILMQTTIPATMGGLSAPYVNAGKVENKGFEFSLKYNKRFHNSLRIGSTLNLSHIDNKVIDLNGSSPIINGATVLAEDYPINSFYGYKQDGIYQISDFTWQNSSDESIAHKDRNYTLKDGVVGVDNYTAQPGDLKFKDLNNDGKVDMTNDRTVIGDQFPDFQYSWQFNADWHKFDFSMFWQGVQGIDGYTYYEISTCFSGVANCGTWWKNRWTPEHPSNSMPAVTLTDSKKNIHSTFYMEDASYLRLKNIELGYTFDQELFPLLNDCTVRIYGNIQNALTFTDYKGFDPEQETSSTRAESFPQVRIYTVGVNINF